MSPRPRGPETTAAAHEAARISYARRAAAKPAELSRAVLIVRAALAEGLLDHWSLTPLELPPRKTSTEEE